MGMLQRELIGAIRGVEIPGRRNLFVLQKENLGAFTFFP